MFLAVANSTFTQEKKANSEDVVLKDSIYNASKTKVLNYSMKDFEKLFFEFNDKQFDQNILLTEK
jgi:hypothetical protein